MKSRNLFIQARLAAFIEAGELTPGDIPTWWQLRQAEIEMTPYVLSTDATQEDAYEGRALGHPWLRQPLIFTQVGLDHFRTGSGLGARHTSLCNHLHLTYHQGMPVFDLQVIQTHERGLERLRQRTEELLATSTPAARRIARIGTLTLADPQGYYDQFLGDHGWIARAQRFDYPGPDAEGAAFPSEFFSLLDLVRYAAHSFDAHPRDAGWTKLPLHLARLSGRRRREGRGFGWFARHSRSEVN